MSESNKAILNPIENYYGINNENVYELDEYIKSTETKMAISVIGLGYVGAVTSACFSKLGHKVVGVDSDEEKVKTINAGISPIFEADLEKEIKYGIQHKTLSAITSINQAVFDSELTIISVGTPSEEDGGCKLVYLENVCKEVGMALRMKHKYHTIMFKSTVPPGTTESKLVPILESYSGKKQGVDFGVCFNPEFLRESTALDDFYNPPITLIGAMCSRSAAIAYELFMGVNAEIHLTSIAAAEFVKYIDNTWHATKVCFANEIGRLCHALDVDSQEVMDLFVKDTKLNISPYYLKPGFAFGGSCLPKDTRGINHLAKSLNVDMPLISGLNPSNDAHIDHVMGIVKKTGSKKIGLCGLTFKSGTDDMRESPNEKLMHRLIKSGYDITFFDPLLSPEYHFDDDVEKNLLIHASRRMHVNELVKHNEVIILAHGDEFSELACDLATDHQQIIDLVGVTPNADCKAQYQGICW